MGHKHTKEDILLAAFAEAHDEGLSRLTFGRVAKRIGISDRTVVYYFPTKDDLITEVLMSVGVELQKTLASAFTGQAADHLDLASRAWPVLTRPESDAIFALFFEANGLAASGRSPYDTLMPQLVEAWIDWAASLLPGSAKQRRAQAAATIALVDGLLLLRHLSNDRAADQAARVLGVR